MSNQRILGALALLAPLAACSSNGVQPGSGGSTGHGGATASGSSATSASSGGGASSSATGTGGAATGSGGAGGQGGVAPGWSLVAVDTPLRTYLDYVDVPSSGIWTPEADGWPMMAQWEQQTTRTGLRFQSFKPGDVLTPAQIIALLPIVAVAAKTIDITAPPYNAQVAPADATTAINQALHDAGLMAAQGAPVDVLVPAGTFAFSKVLVVPHDVRLRRWPEDTGGTLQATDPDLSAVHLTGDRSGALFLVMISPATKRTSTPWSGSIWVGGGDNVVMSVEDTLVVGNDVSTPSSAHIFGLAEKGGLWAFNHAHDGYADTFHHTGRSSYCQVVANRARTQDDRGDDLYAFVGYAGNGDPVHHCSCIANWGRDGHARGLAAVGAGFISFQNNDISRTQAAGIYLAQEDSYHSFGTFDIRVTGNVIDQANLNLSHDGLLAFSNSPATIDPSTTFGMIPHRVERLTIQGNTFANTSPGIGNGFGVEIRNSVDTGDVSNNVLTNNKSPQLVINGTGFTQSGNTITP
ncbi:putative lipoprotein [Minicystis rosea]|nr:putative lipoprotein [Minicystis rosea]